MKISFIGAGNMGEALLSGMLDGNEIIATDVSSERLDYISRNYNVEVSEDNRYAAKKADVIFICVKPKDISSVLEEITGSIDKNKLTISIAAGVTTDFIESRLGNVPIIRAMPNLSVVVKEGLIALCKGRYTTEENFKLAVELFSKCGEVISIEESKMDMITALSGSGPAYLFYLAECMLEFCEKYGLKFSDRVVNRTLFGAAKMLADRGDAKELRMAVSSPGGTTEAAIKYLEANGFKEIFIEAVKRAMERSKELRR